MRVAIIDDEPPARARLRELLSAHPEVEIVGEAGSVEQAMELCERLKPEVLFLDIELGRLDGFALLEELPGERPALVFVTAHEEFALPAFNVEAVDYLLKPVPPERLKRALKRLELMLPGREEKVQIPLDSGLLAVGAREIACVQADQNYTHVHLRDGRTFYVRRGVQAWDDLLPDPHFARLHRSLVINLDAVRSLTAESRDTGLLELEGMNQAIPLARRALQRLRQLLA